MVNLGSRSYSVQIGPGLLDAAGPACAKLRLGRRAAVVTQPAVERHAARVTQSLRGAGFDPAVIVVTEGEESKSLRQAERSAPPAMRSFGQAMRSMSCTSSATAVAGPSGVTTA